MNAVILLGDPTCTAGTYLLRVRLSRAARVAFGRFAGGRRLLLPAGEYAYVGSAMGARGSASLGCRLLRHATRTGDRPPHALRGELALRLQQAGLLRRSAGAAGAALDAGEQPETGASRAVRPKRLRWHVDYLLDHRAASLRGVIVWRWRVRLEGPLAAWLVRQPGTRPVAPSLGAGDDPGQTHLLAVPADDEWWSAVAARWAAGYLGGPAAGRSGPLPPRTNRGGGPWSCAAPR
ncbi:MAG: DUF123 domain-containing protein [Candidatus Latescibacterota bacterium]